MVAIVSKTSGLGSGVAALKKATSWGPLNLVSPGRIRWKFQLVGIFNLQPIGGKSRGSAADDGAWVPVVQSACCPKSATNPPTKNAFNPTPEVPPRPLSR